jgi:hypothetical protein
MSANGQKRTHAVQQFLFDYLVRAYEQQPDVGLGFLVAG